jgi:hypothetical protein
VLNTIDDALDRSDPGGTEWGADAVKHLAPLLDRARHAGRIVVLTADHGHIVERRQGTQRAYASISSGRSRAAIEPGADGEVLVTGRRVLLHEGRAVLAVDEHLRYGPLKAGYHVPPSGLVPCGRIRQSAQRLLGVAARRHLVRRWPASETHAADLIDCLRATRVTRTYDPDKRTLQSEEADGTQTEWISVFTRAGDGTVRHVYSKGAQMADDRRERGIDLLSPVWHLLDLTPHGRGDWYPSLNY